MSQIDPIQFKRSVAEFFNDWRDYDHESDFHPRLAQGLIELANLQPWQTVLDIAIGTGLIAIAAAQKVAPNDWVVGNDAKRSWNPDSKNPLIHSLRQLSPQTLERAKPNYFAALEALNTNDGIWNDILTFFAVGRKPK